MTIHTYGANAVDWEQRVDLARLRTERLARLKAQLEASSLGALLSFDFANIRYMTATHIGTWGMDKLVRFALLPRGGEPVVWDFGSAARHHQLYNPWLDHTGGPPTPEGARATGARAGISTLRGALHPDAGIAADVAAKVAGVLREHGLAGSRSGSTSRRCRCWPRCAPRASRRSTGSRYSWRRGAPRPGTRSGCWPRRARWSTRRTSSCMSSCGRACGRTSASAWSPRSLYDLGSEFVEGVNAISGERCSPHPHVYSDRLIRPGDPAFFDILHSYLGYRTCYYRTFAVGSASVAQRDAYVRCREYMDQAIAMVRPGVTTGDIVSLWPRAEEFGFPDEMAAFALQYGHGVGLSIWEKPIFSRLVSLDHPEPLEEGMVFALETYWPAADGWSAARIEEEVVVTADGCEVITKFPAEELLVAGRKYWTAGGALDTLRESQSNLNTAAGRGEKGGDTA